MEKVKFKEFSEGISNKFIGCIEEGLEVGEMILFWFFGNKIEFFIDWEKEFEIF